MRARPFHTGINWRDYLWSALVVTACSLIAYVLHRQFDPTILVLVYLLGIVFVATRFTLGAAIAASVLSVAALDWFFVPPYFQFVHPSEPYFLTLMFTLGVALAVSSLAAQVRHEEALAREGERKALALCCLSANLSRVAEEAAVRAKTEEMKNILLSSVSHDLKTPLSSIMGAASSLTEGAGSMQVDSLKELSESIYLEAERLNRLVSNLLDMTRLESGAIKVRKDWQDIEETIGAALSRMEKRLGRHKILAAVPPNLPLTEFDEVLIEQVIVNLLDNAMKYSPVGAEIRVSASASNSTLTIEITNEGAALDEQERDRIFEKFYRGKTGAAHVGSGLGLAICRAIVEAHGGKIWVDNVAGSTSFRFTLPAEGNAPQISLPESETIIS